MWCRIGWEHGAMNARPQAVAKDLPPVLLSYAAELAALEQAALWTSVWVDANYAAWHARPQRVVIAVDNQAALQVAAGHGKATTPWARGARFAWQAVQSRLTTEFAHVQGHAGFLVNEIADCLAGLASKGTNASPTFPRPLTPLWNDLWEQSAEHLWLVPFGTLVGQSSMHMRFPDSEGLPSPYLDAAAHNTPDCQENGDRQERVDTIPFRAVQANVQTIKDVTPHFFNKAGTGQRRAYLSRQLKRLRADIVTLQECRSRAGRWATGSFLTWRSGADRAGQGGCEVWVRADWLPDCSTLEAWTIHDSSPRLLAVSTARRRPPVVIVAAHAPHADRPPAEIRAFWGALSTCLREFPAGSAILVGIDANADFTHADEMQERVGSLVSGADPRLGDERMFQLICDHNLQAPATLETVHVGPRWTWRHASGLQKRLDHWLTTAQHWTFSKTRQCPEFDILLGARDHMPLSSQGVLSMPSTPPSVSRRLASPVECASLAPKVWGVQPPWEVLLGMSPAEQVACLQSTYDKAVAGLPRRPVARPTQPYLSREAWNTLRLLKRVRALKEAARRQAIRRWLRICFRAWRRPDHRPRQQTRPWHLFARLARQERCLARRAHTLGRRDKARHLLSLLAAATGRWHATGRTDQALLRLRWASRRAADRRRVKAAGGFATQAQLREQFREQEAGTVVTPAALANTHAEWQQTPGHPCVQAVPSLTDVEAICRKQKADKAPGPDGVRNGLWRTQPAAASRWLWLLQAKMALKGREPPQFKHAIVCALYKKGPAHLPSNYRSIALLNGAAKLWHSHIRNTVGRRLVQSYQPLQLGGKPGMHVGYALTAYRAATGLTASNGHSLAAMFVDVQAAFYEVDRGLLFGEDACRARGQQILPWLQSLLDAGALDQLGLSPAETCLLQDCVAGSSWLLRGDKNPILAARGSRPDDGLADILFGAVMACLIRHLTDQLSQAGIAHHGLSLALGYQVAQVCPIAWADDLVVLADVPAATLTHVVVWQRLP
ncbi:CPK2 [Symbiodinium natans]|uniref:CPK2 protein n=1 Tax=Symbiodinium natans TaxID=878477 RepID=A0A812JJ89_9DINO|nr:CPK2 [Symbiodinium natans]